MNSFAVSEECYTEEVTSTSAVVPSSSSGGGGSGVSLSTEVLVCKDSCPLDGKCYPVMYRKGGKYCSDSGSFEQQLEGNAACDNSFECKSNVCVNGECISSGLIEKIMSWFKKMFGGE